jgi:hypothetical protein
MLLAMVPLPMPPVKFAVPVSAKAVNVEFADAVAFTVNVVLIVAAGTAAHTSSAKAKTDPVRFISLLESSTRKTLKFRGNFLLAALPIPTGRANPMR